MKKITTFLRSAVFLSKTPASKALRRVVRNVLFLIIFSSFSSYTIAGIQEKQNIPKMVQRSDLIIRGKVISTESQWKENSRGRHIYTSVTVKILDKIKGNIKDDVFAFEVVGGTVDDIREVVSDIPVFEINEDAIMFLAGQPLTIKQGINSKIPIYNGRVYRNDSEITVDSFIQAIRILEQDPNAPVSFGKKYQATEAAAAECFIYSGYEWPGTSPIVSYKINENTSDCTGEGAAVQSAANTWNNVGANFTFQYGGSHTSTVTSQNYVNEIMWGTTDDSIATTHYWVYDTGEIVECDIVFNNTDYTWSTKTVPYSWEMDAETVALHEFGHWLSLDDLYDDADSGNIMYGYGDTGEVKRILQPCDIAGICSIYGGCPTNYTLTVNSSGASGVSISSSTGHEGITNYTKTVTSETTVTLTAPSTASGKIFTGWTGNVTSSNPTISFAMSGNKSVTANYTTVNDIFANAITISGASGQTTGSNVGTTKESGEPSHAGNSGGKSVWWNWTAPSNGQMSIDTFGSSFDTLLAVYTGNSVGSLIVIASNDDSGGGQSQVAFTVVSGTTYRIAVDGYNGVTGNITVNWSLASTNYTLTVNSSGASDINISSSTGHGGTTNYTKTVSSGTSVNLQAPLYVGYCASRTRFDGWTGSVTSVSQSITFTMDGINTVTANYVADPETYTLTVNSSGASDVDISSSTGHGGITNYTKTVTCGTSVMLTASSTADGNNFQKWQLNGLDLTTNQTVNVTMDTDYTLTTVYVTPPDAPVLREEPNMTPGLCNMISWGTVPQVKDYYAECSSDPCFLSVDYNSGWITRTSYQFCGLTGCQEYWYRVKSGLSAWSQTSQAEFQNDTLTDTTATSGGDVVLAESGTSLVDTAGDPNYSFDTDTDSYFNGFLVTTETTLTQIEIYLGISTSMSIEFVVYEGGASFTDSYNRIHLSTLASSDTGTKFYTSGPISVPLEAGKYYMIGAVWSGSVTAYYDEIDSSPSFADYTGWGVYYGFSSPNILSEIYNDPPYTFYHRYTTTQAAAYTSSGSVVSTPINLPAGGNWGIVDFNKTTPVATALTVDILPAVDSTPIPGYENVPRGADLGGISEPAIRLRANLSTNDEPNSTPALHDWSITYTDPAGIESVWSNIESSIQVIPGDFEPDCDVDLADLAVLTEQWLLVKLSADVWPDGGDGVINLLDLAVFANAWQSMPSFPNWNPKCDIAPQGGDGIVDISDLAVFTGQWLQFGAYSADIAPQPTGDGIVNFPDFVIFSQHWLEGVGP